MSGTHDSTARGWLLATLLVSLAALGVSLASLLGQPSPSLEASRNNVGREPTAVTGRLDQLEERMEQLAREQRELERRLQQRRGEAASPASSPERPEQEVLAGRSSFDEDAGLEERLARLELQVQQWSREQENLADPDGIPAALAVLLASRGVVTKIGDIEKIQASMPVFADIVRDPSVSDWQRLEAYRGMLMWGFEDEEQVRAVTIEVARLAATSTDARIRRTAASFTSTYSNPDVIQTLSDAYFREQDAEVRDQLIQTLIASRQEASVRDTLKAALATETSAKTRARIEKALADK